MRGSGSVVVARVLVLCAASRTSPRTVSERSRLRLVTMPSTRLAARASPSRSKAVSRVAPCAITLASMGS